jgi:hypothetical protein
MTRCLTALGALAAALMIVPFLQSPALALPASKAAAGVGGAVTEIRHRGGFRFHGGGFKHRGIHPRGFAFHGSKFHHGPKFHWRKFHHGRHFHHRKFRFVLPYYYAYPYYYSYDYDYDSCHWLRVKALRTGNPYWWRRYEECIYWR